MKCNWNTYRLRAHLAVDKWPQMLRAAQPCFLFLHDVSPHDFSERNFSRIDGLYVTTQSRGIWNKGRNNGTRRRSV